MEHTMEEMKFMLDAIKIANPELYRLTEKYLEEKNKYDYREKMKKIFESEGGTLEEYHQKIRLMDSKLNNKK